MMKYYTGNEHISLINIDEDLTINGLSFLSMGLNGNIFLDCSIRQKLIVNNYEFNLNVGKFDYKNYWIPELKIQNNFFSVSYNVFAPKDKRGFIKSIRIKNTSKEKINIKLKQEFILKNIFLNINTSYKINPEIRITFNEWFKNIAVTAIEKGIIFSLALGADFSFEYKIFNNNILMTSDLSIESQEEKEVNYFFGIGAEDMAAFSSNVYFERQKVANLFNELESWLYKNIRIFQNKNIEKIYNTNLFFNYFFTNGITIDTEELVCVTSRSPEYYVSGAYWDRDIFLWSFPAILDMDVNKAKLILEYGFKIQGKNFGVHSRFINGNTLECGFELDELCAPFMALESYIKKTGDFDFLKKYFILEILNSANDKFKKWKHTNYFIYATELRPSDDMATYKYNTYDNVLTWRTFKSIAYLYKILGNKKQVLYFNNLSRKLIKDIKRFAFIVKEKIIAYEFDTKNNYILYEEPAGSLKLLYYYGFLEKNNIYYKNTLRWIYSEKNKYFFKKSNFKETGCIHATQPWPLSAANSIFVPNYEKFGIDFFKNVKMDNFYACESVDENKGTSKTGKAFATAAGFIVKALKNIFDV